MKIGVALFTYKRADVLKTVLQALKNIEEIDTLYIFQDGINDTEAAEEKAKWREVNQMINQIDWCRTIIEASQANKGLTTSIIMGINRVLEENDAVIVIEDDCVPHRDFYAFMKQSLEKYADDGRVYSVSGYAWPLDMAQPQGVDAYFCGRISTWGWGTWKDRWEKYSRDYLLLEKARGDRELSARLGLWGNDMEGMLVGNLKGTVDSWDMFWVLLVINERGHCLNPYRSLIQYSGFDGEGRHCGDNTTHILANAEFSPQQKTDFKLPARVEILSEIEDAFVRSGLFKAVKDMDNAEGKERVLLYGIGNFYQRHERYLHEKYQIEAFIDRYKRGYLHGKDIIRLGGITRYNYDKIIIMLENIGQCIAVAATLAGQGVEAAKIVLGHDIVDSRIRFWDRSEWGDGGLTLHIGATQITVAGVDEFNNVAEVHGGGYVCSMNSTADNIILDVGMNIGSASLYFLENYPNSTIYGFEPFKPTFAKALENLQKSGYYPHQRVQVFNYGLSDHDEEKGIVYNRKMSCGQSADEQVNQRAREFYMKNQITTTDDDQLETIELRKASTVLADILKKHPNKSVMLKMDCEGSEYAVFRDLEETGLLGSFRFVMLEWHYQGSRALEEALERTGYSFWSKAKSSNMGLIYACKG